jgi:preprotein translocase subunit SecE
MANVDKAKLAQSQAARTLAGGGPVKFLKEVIAELKKVTWPTRNETIKLTFTVIAISIIVGAFIGGVDAMLVNITGLIFKK